MESPSNRMIRNDPRKLCAFCGRTVAEGETKCICGSRSFLSERDYRNIWSVSDEHAHIPE